MPGGACRGTWTPRWTTWGRGRRGNWPPASEGTGHLKAQGVWQPTIHASDLSRAYATAEALFTELGGTLTAQAGLREIHMGDWEGELYDDIQTAHPELSTRFWGGDPHAGAPDGETPARVKR